MRCFALIAPGLSAGVLRTYMYQTSHLGDRRVSEQFALFESPASEPEGLQYLAGFVSAETEQKLISEILDLPLQPFQFGQFQGIDGSRRLIFATNTP
jgi:hypothetical protein